MSFVSTVNREIKPDIDGYITFQEANEWYRRGNGKPLYADLSKINLSKISAREFSIIEDYKVFNLLSPKYLSSLNDALVYGNITLTLNESNFVTATYGYDIYNFDIKPWKISTFFRNIEAIVGKLYAGKGTLL